MIRRLFQLMALAAVATVALAAARRLRRHVDPLPETAAPVGEAWPPAMPLTTADAERTDAVQEPSTPTAPPTAPDAPTTATGDGAGSVDSAWCEPTEAGECPEGHPIKAKMSSRIYHAPGQLNYERTSPDRCYVDAEAAEADGLRAAKR